MWLTYKWHHNHNQCCWASTSARKSHTKLNCSVIEIKVEKRMILRLALGRKKNRRSGHQVWAWWKTGKFQTNKKPVYSSGELTSFSNFDKHLNICHYEEYSRYKKSKSLNDSSSSKPTSLILQQFRTMSKVEEKNWSWSRLYSSDR
jgi:hypothetical protein